MSSTLCNLSLMSNVRATIRLKRVYMSFANNSVIIKNLVQDDLSILEQNIVDLFKNKTPLDKDLLALLTAPSKRLRPLLGILFLRCLQDEISSAQQNVFLAVELIHNATLIHDDIIDKADERRNQKTLNVKFDENLAVVAGDFLLSVAMEKIIETKSIEVLKVFTSALKSTCIGEINQYFGKFKILSIDDYVQKSKEKTALLFKISVLGALLLSENEKNEALIKSATDFSENFGIAFQIRDDLINILNADKLLNNDLELGVYTAPVIFAHQEDEKILLSENILKSIKDSQGIEKTKDLMDNYFNKSISAIESINNNAYKFAIFELIEVLKNNL